jgi:hypothetical protein
MVRCAVRFLFVAAWLVVGFAALVSASVGASAATPLAPAPGATTSSHPVFTWSLGPSEESDTVHIASRPDTTPEGQFHDENVVMTGAPEESTATTWSPVQPLFAGHYWWNVETRDADFMPAFSPAREFTVAPEVRLLSVRLSRATFLRQVTVDLRWVSNAHDVAMELRLLRKGRVVGLARGQLETLISGDPERGTLQWRAPRRVRPGTRLVVRIRVTGAGQSATAQRTIRAP